MEAMSVLQAIEKNPALRLLEAAVTESRASMDVHSSMEAAVASGTRSVTVASVQCLYTAAYGCDTL